MIVSISENLPHEMRYRHAAASPAKLKKLFTVFSNVPIGWCLTLKVI